MYLIFAIQDSPILSWRALHDSLTPLKEVFDYPRARELMLISHMRGSQFATEMEEENLEATEELLKKKIKEQQQYKQDQENSTEVDEQYVVDQINNAESEVINKANKVWETRAHRIQDGEIKDGLGAIKQIKTKRGGRPRGNSKITSNSNRMGSLGKKSVTDDDSTNDDAIGDDGADDDGAVDDVVVITDDAEVISDDSLGPKKKGRGKKGRKKKSKM
jgi:hypothetical protein